MAETPISPATLEPSPKPSEAVNPISIPDPQPAASIPPPINPHQLPQQLSALHQPNPNPNQNPNFAPPLVPGYGHSTVPGAALSLPPSFRPMPQFNPVPSPNYQAAAAAGQNQGMQPPGVNGAAASLQPGMMLPYQIPPNQGLRPYAPMPNGYAPQGTVLPLV